MILCFRHKNERFFSGGLLDSLLLFSITNTTFHFFILMSQFREPLNSWSFPFRPTKIILPATLVNYSAAIELNILDKISTVGRERMRKNCCQLYFPCWRSKTPDSNKSSKWEWNDTSYESYSSPKLNIFALGIRETLFLKNWTAVNLFTKTHCNSAARWSAIQNTHFKILTISPAFNLVVNAKKL